MQVPLGVARALEDFATVDGESEALACDRLSLVCVHQRRRRPVIARRCPRNATGVAELGAVHIRGVLHRHEIEDVLAGQARDLSGACSRGAERRNGNYGRGSARVRGQQHVHKAPAEIGHTVSEHPAGRTNHLDHIHRLWVVDVGIRPELFERRTRQVDLFLRWGGHRMVHGVHGHDLGFTGTDGIVPTSPRERQDNSAVHGRAVESEPLRMLGAGAVPRIVGVPRRGGGQQHAVEIGRGVAVVVHLDVAAEPVVGLRVLQRPVVGEHLRDYHRPAACPHERYRSRRVGGLWPACTDVTNHAARGLPEYRRHWSNRFRH